MSSNAQDQPQQQQLRRSRLRILPGSVLLGNIGGSNDDDDAFPEPPEPPAGPPPDPTEIVRLVLLGDRHVGKSSVVQKFISRRYCNSNPEGGGNDETDNKSVRSGRSHKSGRSSKSHRSHRSDRKSHHRQRGHSHRHHKSLSSSGGSRYHHPLSPDSHASARSAESGAKHDVGNDNQSASGGIELIRAEYHKKDVTMWLPSASPSSVAFATTATAAGGESKSIKKRSALHVRRVSENHASSGAGGVDDDNLHASKAGAHGVQAPVCARLQVWDATGQDIGLSDEDNGETDAGKVGPIISNIDSKWSQIFRNAAGAVIVCTLGDEDVVIGDRRLDRQSIMDHLERRIRRWLALVDAYNGPTSSLADGTRADNSLEFSAKRRMPVTLIVNKSDLISAVLSSSDWVRVGAQMERLCERLGIDGGWYTSTCLEPRSTTDVAEDSLSGGAWDEDHDGAEMAFLSMVRSNLLAKRQSAATSTACCSAVVSDKDPTKTKDKRDGKSPRRKSKGHSKSSISSSSRRARSRSRSRPRAPKFPIDP